MTALAVAMATPLSVVVHVSIANAIAACVGDKDAQSMVRKSYCKNLYFWEINYDTHAIVANANSSFVAVVDMAIGCM